MPIFLYVPDKIPYKIYSKIKCVAFKEKKNSFFYAENSFFDAIQKYNVQYIALNSPWKNITFPLLHFFCPTSLFYDIQIWKKNPFPERVNNEIWKIHKEYL